MEIEPQHALAFHDLVMSGACTSRGSVCRFVKVDDQIGIKIYNRKSYRDNSYIEQKIWADRGYAPKTYGTFEVNNKYFCFITEVVDTVAEHGNNSAKLYHNIRNAETGDFFKRLDELMTKLKKEFDFNVPDGHAGNFGYNKAGELIMIDFA